MVYVQSSRFSCAMTFACLWFAMSLLSSQRFATPKSPHEPQLLTKSVKVLAIGEQSFAWLSDHEVLHIGAGGNLYRYNMATKVDSLVPKLSDLIKESCPRPDIVGVSPDGKWVLWTDPWTSGSVFTAPIDGAKMLTWHLRTVMLTQAWCDDSHHWLLYPSMGVGQKPHAYDTDEPGMDNVLPVPADLRYLDILAVVSDEMIFAGSVYGAHDWMHVSGAKFPFELTCWSLHKAAPLKTWTIRLPDEPTDVVVNPVAGRVAWTLEPDGGGYTTAIFVSNIDGTRLHEIGGINGALHGRNITIDLSSIRWLPGGKRISFTHGGALWVVPVD